MVLLHYKKTEHNQFLFETTLGQSINDLINELTESTHFQPKELISQ